GGVVLGALLTGKEGPARSWVDVRRAVLAEAVILVIFAATALVPWPFADRIVILALISVSGFAMGLQSATVPRLNLPGIATTYITGTITSLFSGLVHNWSALKRGVSSGAESTGSSEMEGSLALQAEVFLSYTVSALITAVLHAQWPSGVALLPFAAVAMAGFSMYWRHAPRAPAP